MHFPCHLSTLFWNLTERGLETTNSKLDFHESKLALTIRITLNYLHSLNPVYHSQIHFILHHRDPQVDRFPPRYKQKRIIVPLATTLVAIFADHQAVTMPTVFAPLSDVSAAVLVVAHTMSLP